LRMKRRFDPAVQEIMDLPQPVSGELEEDLHNLRQLNRFFGSYALVHRFLRQWIPPGASLRVIDLATGSGDIPRLVAQFARKLGASVKIDAIDGQEATLEIARRLSSGYPEISFHHGDIRSWGDASSYDIVLCSLVLHHFDETDAVRVLARAAALSRGHVLVSDLRRGFLATAGVFLLTALVFREAMTKHDGRLSAARAFSSGELVQLAERAGWREFQHGNFPWARQAVWLDAGKHPIA
jgi:2-polyprenyl-3-methyl-5-hydroxy-6-metoxy-1,4-benzoquinol methylase